MTAVRPHSEIVAELREWTLPQSSRTWPIAEEAAACIEALIVSRDNWHALVDQIHENEDALLPEGVATIEDLAAERDAAQAVLAAVQAALDQYDAWPDDAIPSKAATACVSTIAKAVRP